MVSITPCRLKASSAVTSTLVALTVVLTYFKKLRVVSEWRRWDQEVLQKYKIKKPEKIILTACPWVSFPGARATPPFVSRALGNQSESRIFRKRPDKVFIALVLPKFPQSKIVLAFRFARKLLEVFHSIWMRNLSKPARREDLAPLFSKMILSWVVYKNALALFVSN